MLAPLPGHAGDLLCCLLAPAPSFLRGRLQLADPLSFGPAHIIWIIERATIQISPGPGSYLFILEFERKPEGNLTPLQGRRGQRGRNGRRVSLRKLSGPPGSGARVQTPPGARARPEQWGADQEGWMPLLAVLFVVLVSILSSLRGRLQGPRLRILKLFQAELREPARSSSPASHPRAAPGQVFPASEVCKSSSVRLS